MAPSGVEAGGRAVVWGFVPLTFNQFMRAHWRKQRAQGPRWATFLRAALGPSPRKPIEVAEVTVTVYRTMLQDPNNVSASCKSIFDALQVRSKRHPYGLGWIRDDSAAHLVYRTAEVKCKRQETRTVVEVRPVEGGGSRG